MNKEQITETLTTALEIIKKLQAENRKLTVERDMHKGLKDIESHRVEIATKTIEEYEDELGYNEGYCLSPDDSDQKRKRKLTAMRKSRCIRYLNQEHGYEID